MASRHRTLRAPSSKVLVAVLVFSLAAVAVALAASRFELFSSRPAQPGGVAIVTPSLPMPTADDTATVLSPESVANKITADQAVEVARANAGALVGKAPLAQLVSITARSPDSQLNGFVGWVILSTDVPGFIGGPINAPSIDVAATYSWVFVSAGGDVVAETQVSYTTPGAVPALP